MYMLLNSAIGGNIAGHFLHLDFMPQTTKTPTNFHRLSQDFTNKSTNYRIDQRITE